MRKKHNHPPKQRNVAPPAATPGITGALQRAFEHHQAGRLAEAETVYREVLSAEPSNPVATHLLGVVAYQVQQYTLALQLIDAALQINPQYAEAHSNRGVVLHAMRRYSDAVVSYERSLALNPQSADTHNNIANSLYSLQQYQAALDSADRALALRTDYAEAWNNRGNALLALGQHAEAIRCFDRAIALRPDYADAYGNRGNALQANTFAGRSSDKRSTSGRDLVIYCTPVAEIWNPETARTHGVGGSEEAVIWLSQLLHRRGWNVTVYANCGLEEHIYDGVRWRPHWLWNRLDRQDVTVLWRSPHFVDEEINSERIIVDLHDVVSETEFSAERVAKIDRIFVKSKFHRSLYPQIPDDKFEIVPNGIDGTIFEHNEDRDPYLLINTSSADRSLAAFLDCFAAIREHVPQARAQWAYGWGVWDEVNAANAEMMAWKREMQTRMRELGVIEHGRLSHNDVAALYRRANIFAYPSEMAEIDCISLSKAMAAGAIPLTTDFAAMGEKAGHGGVFLHSQKTKESWTQPGQFHFEMTDEEQTAEFVEHAVKLLRNPPTEAEREPMRHWARTTFEWNTVADAWHKALAKPEHHHAALQDYEKALALNPYLAEAHNNRGAILHSLQEYNAALASYDQAIALRSEYSDAYHNRANALLALKDFPGALAAFEQTIALQADFEYARGMRLYLKRLLCDWNEIEEETADLEAAILRGERVALPFATLALVESPALQRLAAEIYSRDKFPLHKPAGILPARPSHEKIRIGYFSSDFYNHATSYLMAELFEQHDRSRFEIIGFSFGPPASDEMGIRVAAAMDRFVDVSTMSAADTAEFCRGLKVDIAVDLKGYTRDHRAGIFVERAAPIQVSYVGYPGTMGVLSTDYLIADGVLIPEQLQQHYTEKIVTLPGTYQPNDSHRCASPTTASRAEEGLPEAGTVFCCFNNAYKITPQVFSSWMRILQRVEGSVLWLLEESATASANLRAEATQRRVSAARLVFVRPVSLPEHLARIPLADLFLDTLPYGAHTTASDALWSGVPVLTRMGETFASRVAASLLHAAGLSEMVTTTVQQYEDLAVALATDASRLHLLRSQLLASRAAGTLFNTEDYVRHLEAAYIAMYWRHTAGLAPDHLKV